MADSSLRRTINPIQRRPFFEPKMRHIIPELAVLGDFVENLARIMCFLLNSHEAVKRTASEK